MNKVHWSDCPRHGEVGIKEFLWNGAINFKDEPLVLITYNCGHMMFHVQADVESDIDSMERNVW